MSESNSSTRELKHIYISGIVSGIFLCLIVILLLQIFGVIPKWWNTEFVKDVYERAGVVEQYVDKYYWKDNVSEQTMSEYAAKGMVSALGDKYSAYYTESEYNETMNGVEGEYPGIGAVIRTDTKTNRRYIDSVQEGKPAARAGVKPQDEIIRVDGQEISEKTMSELVQMIQKEEGETVVLTVGRKENDQTVQKDISIKIETIVSQSVESRMLDDGLGYIRIERFEKATTEQFRTALASLEEQGQKGIVIDVRDNGGGSLEACVEILDRLLPAGKLITEKSKGSGDKVYSSTDKEHFDKPVVILINGNSASASEVFAGTLQDRGAAVVTGTKSFGKGIVQTIYSLENSCGGGIKLTTGEYLLPSGRSIHEVGLTPDVEVEYEGATKKLGAEDDNQLRKAQEILKAQIEG